ncbi:hypothetical protein LENED_010320 [Lentinula edodes]|uniref:Uncharacterized protein n=1 Tax=Lentinula edodes TaxID=5353 RepID=A0A1Q3EM57_LENED|nr:hypothetical protein LENED_010320 [Lentinula edodes]
MLIRPHCARGAHSTCNFRIATDNIDHLLLFIIERQCISIQFINQNMSFTTSIETQDVRQTKISLTIGLGM